MNLVQFWLVLHQMASFPYSPSKVHAHSNTINTCLTNVRAQMMVSGALTSLMATLLAATPFLGRLRLSLDH